MTNQIIEREEAQPVNLPVNQPMRLLELAISNNADVDKLEKLMALQERWDSEQSRKAYFTALADLQSELPVIRKLKTASFDTRSGGKMSYNFASLDDISEQIKPYLQKHGFSYRFEQDFQNNAILITCIVTHKSGHSERCSMPGGADTSGNKNALQQAASTVTYLRRYTLTGALGIATADQDIDGRMAYNGDMNNKNSDLITDENEAALQDHLNAVEDKHRFMGWLSNGVKRQLNSISDLTDDEAKRALDALRNGGKK